MSEATETNLTLPRTGNSPQVYRSPAVEPRVLPLEPVDNSPVRIWRNAPSTDIETAGDKERDSSVITDQFTARLVEPVNSIRSAVIDEYERSDSFRQRIDRWCDAHGFANPGSVRSCELVARQAICNVLCKTTLYEWYHRRGSLPVLPTDIRAGLRTAKKQTDESVFDEYLLDEVAWLAPSSIIKQIAADRTRLLQSSQPAEDIGALYEELLPGDDRKTLGQYRTPPQIAAVLRRWASDGGDTLFDPGMGPAALSSPGFPGWVVSSDPDQVYGIDRSPLSRLLGTVTLTLVDQDHTTQTSDFLALTPAELSKQIDAIVCNPPYTKYNDLSKKYRSELKEQAEQLTGRSIPGKTPLYGYFLYHAGACLSPGDRMAAIIPHHFLHRRYGTALKRYLLDTFRIHTLALSDPTNTSLFDDADTTALLLFLEATSQDDPTGTTRLINIEDVEDSDWHRGLCDVTPGPQDWGRAIHVEQSDLRPEDNWFRQLNPLTVDTTNLTPLSEIADVTRGISTGDNAFFCLTQREVDQYGIHERYLTPLIRTVSTVNGYKFRECDWQGHRESGEEVWLLYLDNLKDVPHDLAEAQMTRETWGVASAPQVETDQPAAGLNAYLNASVPNITSKKLQNSSPWYRVDRRESPEVVIQTLSRNGFNAILNQSSALILNNGNGIYPDESMTQDEIKSLAAFLNSSVADEILQYRAETRASGAYRITSGSLSDVEVIDPRTLDPNITAELAALFDELSEDDSEDSVVVERIDAVLTESVL